MSNYEKILKVMEDVSSEMAEREELIKYIAIALLAKKNLFILGDTGQSKSGCINAFRKRITGAKQFERLMSKQTDEEQLFGRLDLSSIIPGNLPQEELLKDVSYSLKYKEMCELYNQYEVDGNPDTLAKAGAIAAELEDMKKIICTMKENAPKIVTTGKIPDSDIIFLDEIFKSNDGILNSLLTAVNERKYTNEGTVTEIPVISFFSASNEIPDFKEPENQILKPLYDRFELKVVTHYVEEKDNRLAILKKKQQPSSYQTKATITLDELKAMQNEVKRVKVPDNVNDIMDNILCVMRSKDIHISDRKYFNYTPIVQAAAYLRGSDTVSAEDLKVLVNYLWTTPEEISVISETLEQICENPLSTQLAETISMAGEAFDDFNANIDNNRAFAKVKRELIRLYSEANALYNTASDTDKVLIDEALSKLEDISKRVYEARGYTVVPLKEAYEQQAA